MGDAVRRRRDAHAGKLTKGHLAAQRGIDRQPLDIGQVLTHIGSGPDGHVVGGAPEEDIADFLAGHQDGGRSPHVARLDAVRLRLGEVDLDLDLGGLHLQLGVQIDETRDTSKGVLHIRGLGSQGLEVRSEDPDDDGVARPGQNLANPFLQIGLYVATQS